MTKLCCEYLSVRYIWVWIHPETRTWHNTNIQSNTPCRQVPTTRLNCWVFNHKLSGCGFESSCSHLNFRFRAFFEKGVPWHSDNYRVWVHSETRMWHDKNIQFIELYFLQPNTVSITQPIDKGIILSLKAKYRSECFYKWSRQLIQTSLLKMWIY